MSEDAQIELFIREMISFQDKVSSVCYTGVIECLEADNAEKALQISGAMNPDGVLYEIKNVITQIERWYKSKHDEAVIETAKINRISPDKWLFPQSHFGWLSNEIQEELSSFYHTYKSYKSALNEIAEYGRRYSGIIGLLRGAARGLMNPADGIAVFFGESSFDQEEREHQRILSDGANALDTSVRVLYDSIGNAIVKLWDNTTIGILYAIEEEASERDKVNENNRQLVYSNSEQTKMYQPNHKAPAWLITLLIISLLGLFGLGTKVFLLDKKKSVNINPSLVQIGTSAIVYMIIEKMDVKKGPAESYETVYRVKDKSKVEILDESVPGWKKIRLKEVKNGVTIEGWIQDELKKTINKKMTRK